MITHAQRSELSLKQLQIQFFNCCSQFSLPVNYVKTIMINISVLSTEAKQSSLKLQIAKIKSKSSICQQIEKIMDSRDILVGALRTILLKNRRAKKSVDLDSVCRYVGGVRELSLQAIESLMKWRHFIGREQQHLYQGAVLNGTKDQFSKKLLFKIANDIDFLRYSALRKHIQFSNSNDPLFLYPLRRFWNLSMACNYNSRPVINLFQMNQNMKNRLEKADEFLKHGNVQKYSEDSSSSERKIQDYHGAEAQDDQTKDQHTNGPKSHSPPVYLSRVNYQTHNVEEQVNRDKISLPIINDGSNIKLFRRGDFEIEVLNQQEKRIPHLQFMLKEHKKKEREKNNLRKLTESKQKQLKALLKQYGIQQEYRPYNYKKDLKRSRYQQELAKSAILEQEKNIQVSQLFNKQVKYSRVESFESRRSENLNSHSPFKGNILEKLLNSQSRVMGTSEQPGNLDRNGTKQLGYESYEVRRKAKSTSPQDLPNSKEQKVGVIIQDQSRKYNNQAPSVKVQIINSKKHKDQGVSSLPDIGFGNPSNLEQTERDDKSVDYQIYHQNNSNVQSYLVEHQQRQQQQIGKSISQGHRHIGSGKTIKKSNQFTEQNRRPNNVGHKKESEQSQEERNLFADDLKRHNFKQKEQIRAIHKQFAQKQRFLKRQKDKDILLAQNARNFQPKQKQAYPKQEQQNIHLKNSIGRSNANYLPRKNISITQPSHFESQPIELEYSGATPKNVKEAHYGQSRKSAVYNNAQGRRNGNHDPESIGRIYRNSPKAPTPKRQMLPSVFQKEVESIDSDNYSKHRQGKETVRKQQLQANKKKHHSLNKKGSNIKPKKYLMIKGKQEKSNKVKVERRKNQSMDTRIKQLTYKIQKETNKHQKRNSAPRNAMMQGKIARNPSFHHNDSANEQSIGDKFYRRRLRPINNDSYEDNFAQYSQKDTPMNLLKSQRADFSQQEEPNIRIEKSQVQLVHSQSVRKSEYSTGLYKQNPIVVSQVGQLTKHYTSENVQHFNYENVQTKQYNTDIKRQSSKSQEHSSQEEEFQQLQKRSTPQQQSLKDRVSIEVDKDQKSNKRDRKDNFPIGKELIQRQQKQKEFPRLDRQNDTESNHSKKLPQPRRIFELENSNKDPKKFVETTKQINSSNRQEIKIEQRPIVRESLQKQYKKQQAIDGTNKDQRRGADQMKHQQLINKPTEKSSEGQKLIEKHSMVHAYESSQNNKKTDELMKPIQGQLEYKQTQVSHANLAQPEYTTNTQGQKHRNLDAYKNHSNQNGLSNSVSNKKQENQNINNQGTRKQDNQIKLGQKMNKQTGLIEGDKKDVKSHQYSTKYSDNEAPKRIDQNSQQDHKINLNNKIQHNQVLREKISHLQKEQKLNTTPKEMQKKIFYPNQDHYPRMGTTPAMPRAKNIDGSNNLKIQQQDKKDFVQSSRQINSEQNMNRKYLEMTDNKTDSKHVKTKVQMQKLDPYIVKSQALQPLQPNQQTNHIVTNQLQTKQTKLSDERVQDKAKDGRKPTIEDKVRNQDQLKPIKKVSQQLSQKEQFQDKETNKQKQPLQNYSRQTNGRQLMVTDHKSSAKQLSGSRKQPQESDQQKILPIVQKVQKDKHSSFQERFTIEEQSNYKAVRSQLPAKPISEHKHEVNDLTAKKEQIQKVSKNYQPISQIRDSKNKLNSHKIAQLSVVEGQSHETDMNSQKLDKNAYSIQSKKADLGTFNNKTTETNRTKALDEKFPSKKSNERHQQKRKQQHGHQQQQQQQQKKQQHQQQQHLQQQQQLQQCSNPAENMCSKDGPEPQSAIRNQRALKKSKEQKEEQSAIVDQKEPQLISKNQIKIQKSGKTDERVENGQNKESQSVKIIRESSADYKPFVNQKQQSGIANILKESQTVKSQWPEEKIPTNSHSNDHAKKSLKAQQSSNMLGNRANLQSFKNQLHDNSQQPKVQKYVSQSENQQKSFLNNNFQKKQNLLVSKDNRVQNYHKESDKTLPKVPSIEKGQKNQGQVTHSSKEPIDLQKISQPENGQTRVKKSQVNQQKKTVLDKDLALEGHYNQLLVDSSQKAKQPSNVSSIGAYQDSQKHIAKSETINQRTNLIGQQGLQNKPKESTQNDGYINKQQSQLIKTSSNQIEKVLKKSRRDTTSRASKHYKKEKIDFMLSEVNQKECVKSKTRILFKSQTLGYDELLEYLDQHFPQSRQSMDSYLNQGYFQLRQIVTTVCFYGEEIVSIGMSHSRYARMHRNLFLVFFKIVKEQFLSIEDKVFNAYINYLFSNDASISIIVLMHEKYTSETMMPTLQSSPFFKKIIKQPIAQLQDKLSEQAVFLQRTPAITCKFEEEYSSIIDVQLVFVRNSNSTEKMLEKNTDPLLQKQVLVSKMLRSSIDIQFAGTNVNKCSNLASLNEYLQDRNLRELTQQQLMLSSAQGPVMSQSFIYYDDLENLHFSFVGNLMYLRVASPDIQSENIYYKQFNDICVILVKSNQKNHYYLFMASIFEGNESDVLKCFMENVEGKSIREVFNKKNFNGTKVVTIPKFYKDIVFPIDNQKKNFCSLRMSLQWKEYLKGTRILQENKITSQFITPLYTGLVRMNTAGQARYLVLTQISEKDEED